MTAFKNSIKKLTGSTQRHFNEIGIQMISTVCPFAFFGIGILVRVFSLPFFVLFMPSLFRIFIANVAVVGFDVIGRSRHSAPQIRRSVFVSVSRTSVTVSVPLVRGKGVASESSRHFAHYGSVASIVFSFSPSPPDVGIFGLPRRIPQRSSFSRGRSSRPTVRTAQGQRQIRTGFRFRFRKARRVFFFRLVPFFILFRFLYSFAFTLFFFFLFLFGRLGFRRVAFFRVGFL